MTPFDGVTYACIYQLDSGSYACPECWELLGEDEKYPALLIASHDGDTCSYCAKEITAGTDYDSPNLVTIVREL